MTLTELQEIALRQQQQIEINQQLLLAKEKRLKMLKLEEAKNQQLSMLSTQQQQQQQQSQSQQQSKLDPNSLNKLENLKQNVLGQELKIFKLKQLRNQILEYKLSNSNMYSELDLIKNLFEQKERELYNAVNKVAELSKQIEQLRRIKQAPSTPNNKSQLSNNLTSPSLNNNNNNNNSSNNNNNNVSELDRLKQELQIRNKLNEQQAKKIIQQHELFNKKQKEVMQLDKRIDELKQRIAAKRNRLSNPSNLTNNLIETIEITNNEQINTPSQNNNNNNNSNVKQTTSSQSPSKIQPKFATKQEIANTYMNKFGSEAYQKYQAQSIRLIQQNNNQQQQPFIQINDEETESSSVSQNSLPSSSSSVISVSPMPMNTNQSQQLSNIDHNNQYQHTSTNKPLSDLPSHLKLEFDKIKYLPDVVKTIKKRHSISEIESSSTIAPQIYQKLLEKHHFSSSNNNGNNNVNNNNNCSSLEKIIEHPPEQQATSQSLTILLNTNQIQQDIQPQPVKLTTFQPKELVVNNFKKDDEQQSKIQITDLKQNEIDQIVSSNVICNENNNNMNQKVIKSTKSIIKLNTDSNENSGSGNNGTRRVNFDPLALLLDAAVEGELDLVKRCARQVKDISEPNDEGITALHNSVCAGHFEIVKFLVEYGCDINYADNDGWTPLHCAASCNNIQMIKFLIENGASVYATTISDNETAIKKCEEDEEGYQVCHDYLMSVQENLGSKEFNNAIVHALYSYEASEDDELTFNCYDRLIVLDKNENEENGDANDGWWTCKLIDSERHGLVPKNYIGLYPRVKGIVYKEQEESTIC